MTSTLWKYWLAGVVVAGLTVDIRADEQAETAALPAVQMFVPGFSVHELPAELTNLVNVEYAPDGRLFAAGYDGRIHLVRDSNGDGLEDQITTFQDGTTADYPLGMTFHNGAVYVLHKLELVRYVDADGDGVPETRESVLKDWDDPKVGQHPLILRRRVDYGMGLAIGPDGSIYIGMGNAAYNNGYMIDHDGKLGEKGLSHYSPANLRGCVLRFSPDGKTREQLVTGVRYLMSMQFNREGDLFATDQEGATWLPNGNPFDELLQIQAGRHYGFPPRHPKYLPNVIDEPSVFDYGPQHQSLCGFRFNLGRGDAAFGPDVWAGDAFIAGFTRGKLYRTKLVKTAAGYVAGNQLIGALQSMAADVTFSPDGALVVASHTGKPDWGTGPQGSGKLFKIRYTDRKAPQPVAAWSAGRGEFRIAFDKPLPLSQLKSLTKNVVIEAGMNVAAGDRFETLRPGYEVVKRQIAAPRHSVAVLSASLSADSRTLIVNTPTNVTAWNYAVTLPGISAVASERQGLAMSASVDLRTDLCGVKARWTSPGGDAAWEGWLPHVDLSIARALTLGSAEHEQLFGLLETPGTLRLSGQMDLYRMLQPAVQAISKLDYEPPVEKVSVVFSGPGPVSLRWNGREQQPEPQDGGVRVIARADGLENQWVSYEVTLGTRPQGRVAEDGGLRVHWVTDEDDRPRAMPLRRWLLPWARPVEGEAAVVERSSVPELKGADRERGRALFFGEALGCAKCHAIRGEGGKLAPDLTNLVQRDYESVVRDVREPSAAINPDYLSYTVAMTDGRTISGTILMETETTFVIANSDGKLTEVPRAEVDEMRPSTLSNMPKGIVEKLTAEQFRDLLGFLLIEAPGTPKGGTPVPLEK